RRTTPKNHSSPALKGRAKVTRRYAPKSMTKHAKISRREFVVKAITAPALIAALPAIVDAAGEVITFNSPNRQVEFVLFAGGPQLRYRATRATQIAIELSSLSMLVDGVDLCRASTITRIERYRVNENYLTRGVHAKAINSGNGARIFCR